MGLPLPGYALLETTGRKTGKRRRTPVGDGRIGNQFWLVAEHGGKAGYVRNIEHDPHVRLKLREGLRGVLVYLRHELPIAINRVGMSLMVDSRLLHAALDA